MEKKMVGAVAYVIFYVFCVPILFFLSNIFSQRQMLFITSATFLSLSLLRLFHIGDVDVLHASNFLAGIVIAYSYKDPKLLKLFQCPLYSMIAGGLVFILFTLEKPLGPLSTLITIYMFSAVVGGFNAWGLLNTRAVIWLGDISYGIYLIHGVVLWFLFSMFKKYGNLPALNIVEYSILMSLVSVVVVVFASISYIKVEKPAMAIARTHRH